MMRPNPSFLGLLVTLALGVTACAGSTIVSENPLQPGGRQLVAQRPARDDAARSASATDGLSVEATADRVCVHTVRLQALPVGTAPTALLAAGDNVTLRTDGDARALHLSTDGAASAAGTVAGLDGKSMQLWRVAHTGCTANGGLLTPSSGRLVLDPGGADEVQWQFTAGAPDRRI